MKKFFLIIICLLYYNSLFAQDNFPMSAGVFVSIKGGVNAAEIPTGVKNGFSLNSMPDIGANFYLPLSEKNKIGLYFDLAYSSYTFQMKLTGREDKPWIIESNYFSFAPSLNLYGFILGFNFSLPLGLSSDVENINDKLDENDLNFASEVRIGGIIPVFDNEIGRLNILIIGGYFLSGQFNDGENIPNFKTDFNTHPGSLSFGLNYMFNISQNKIPTE